MLKIKSNWNVLERRSVILISNFIILLKFFFKFSEMNTKIYIQDVKSHKIEHLNFIDFSSYKELKLRLILLFTALVSPTKFFFEFFKVKVIKNIKIIQPQKFKNSDEILVFFSEKFKFLSYYNKKKISKIYSSLIIYFFYYMKKILNINFSIKNARKFITCGDRNYAAD